MSHPFDLSGRVAVVTGANTGLGQGIALALAAAGADIAALGRSAPDATAQQVEALGRRLCWIEADLDRSNGLAATIDKVAAQLGPPDILVNNAGTIRRNAALDFSEDDWDAVMGVNLKTAFFLAQAFARHCIAAGRGGKIVNIVSMLSFQGGIRVASYTASKSGLLGVTRLLANEWASQGINVNAIAPGYFATSNTTALRNDEQRNRDILARIPAARWGEPSDLGGAAVFLASRASDYVHGAVLPVDGGWLAR
ncbi:2-deoxy-D-gluconate 3-dehydrogenase [Tahibacter aquaticus]|uniref:2-deoxy-D-gluconate 3-dehydrogenase n=1 Tax=Tahibacter aquaticus TaxID=520092 RepID=A0A4R6YNE1_9GAMM|nr:2-dehydro-3-deoxy-D-gluconate 5-dehydrogenase KduD [Tahibacter aquaticus]TDR39112.1 2-deoxy-D-gluconate 3-dehydrogenase [Tahibacter aquaticus]